VSARRWLLGAAVAALLFACDDSEPGPCETRTECHHVRDGIVPFAECDAATAPSSTTRTDPRSMDGRTYSETWTDYTAVEVCR